MYRRAADRNDASAHQKNLSSAAEVFAVVATGLEPVVSLRSVRFAIVARGADASRTPLLTTLPPRYRPLGDDSAPRPIDVNDVLFAKKKFSVFQLRTLQWSQQDSNL